MSYFPYRWKVRTAWSNIDYAAWKVCRGFCNIFRWMPVVWHDRDDDFEPLLAVLEFKLRRMAACQINGHHVGDKENARNMRMCASLCRRLREDDYVSQLTGPITYRTWFEPTDNPRLQRWCSEQVYSNGEVMADADFGRFVKMADRNKSNDLAYLTKMLRKHLMRWWS